MAAPGSAGSAPESTLGDLARPVRVIDAELSIADVEALLQRRPASAPWLVLDAPGGPVLLSRGWLEELQAGPYGFGRVLHQRRTIGEVAPGNTVVLPASCTVGEAAADLAERRRSGEEIPEAIVVSCSSGLGVVPVAQLFEELAQQYAYRAVHDPLTGLPNRLFLQEQLRPPRSFRPAVFFFIDLDRFKDVNDHFGHSAGDEVLVQFAQRLRSLTRAGDLAARLSGDEFALVTAERLTPGEAENLAQRILLCAATPILVRGTHGTDEMVTVGASVGIATAGDGDLNSDAFGTMVSQADTAMYRAKSLGRGRSVHFSADLLEDRERGAVVRARHAMERRLRVAVDRGELSLQYQPLVSLPSGHVTGMEALARWRDDEFGQVPPDQFIPLAERTGLIVDLGNWVLRTACREAAGWHTDGAGRAPTVAVNVSPVQLMQRGFVGEVVEALADSGLTPDRLCLEITETAAITDLVATAARLEELRELGVRLALDDFGAGHSALALLRALPVHLVKVDRTFVQRVTSETADAVLVRLVVEAAHSLGLKVCAEGVETLDQTRQLVALGCDSAQGWLFGRPADVPTFARARGESSDALVTGPAPLPLHSSDELVVVTTPDLVITYASANIGPVLGWSPQDLVGTSVSELLHPEDVERVRTGRPVVPNPGIDGSVHRARHRDGGLRWLRTSVQRLTDTSGALREVVTVSRDVTAAMRAQAALQASEAMFRHAFDDAPIGMALTDLDGRFIRVNKAYAGLVGRTPEQLAELTVADVTHPDDRVQDDANLGQVRRGDAQVHDVTKRYLRADGTAFVARVQAAVVFDESGQPAHIFAHVVELGDAPD